MIREIRRFILAAVLLFSTVSGLSAGGPEPLSLAGRVVDAEGRPMAGVEVWREALLQERLQGIEERLVATTGPDGTFTLRDVPILGRIWATRPGWLRDEFSYRVPPSGQVELRLRPAGRIAGRVVDEQGVPVAGALVSTERSGRVTGCVVLDAYGNEDEVRTDGEGRFTFDPLEPGWFEIDVRAAGFEEALDVRRRSEPGRRVEDVEIVLVRNAVLEGRVVDADGAPLAGASVDGRATTDAAGWYRAFDYAPGRHQISVAHREHGWTTVEVEALQGPNRLDVRLPRAIPVRGRIVLPDGSPATEARAGLLSSYDPFYSMKAEELRFSVPPGRHEIRVEAEGWPTASMPFEAKDQPVDLEIRLQEGSTLSGRVTGLRPGETARIEARGGEGLDERSAEAGSDGRYRLDRLAPGRWKVRVDTGYRSQERLIEVAAEGRARADFRFAPTVPVQGRVLDATGYPAAGIEVHFTRDDQVFSKQSAADGSFQAHLDAGVWSAWAQRPELGAGASPLMPLTVKEFPIAGVEIRLSPPVPVSGRILGLEPGEIAHVVRAVGEHPMRDRLGAADHDGGFRVPDLTPGTWRIEATRGLRVALATVRIAPDTREARVDLVFPSGDETLAGQVLGWQDDLYLESSLRLLGATSDEASYEVPFDMEAEGLFAISGLAPGRYALRWEDHLGVVAERIVEVPGDPVVLRLADFARLRYFSQVP